MTIQTIALKVSNDFDKNRDITKRCTVALESLGLLKISGEKAPLLLQGQLTCHIDEIMREQQGLGAHCNPQGRIISFFRIFYRKENGDFYLQMPRSLVPIARQALQKYAVFFKVELTDLSDSWIQVGHIGPIEEKGLWAMSDALSLNVFQLPGRLIILGERSLDLSNIISMVPNETQWQLLDLQAGIARIFPETCEKFLPHELNLPALQAVHFHKGCYTGQEIISRMQYRGKLKTQLLYAKVEAPGLSLQRGADIYSEKAPVGRLVDFIETTPHQFELLLVAPAEGLLFIRFDNP